MEEALSNATGSTCYLEKKIFVISSDFKVVWVYTEITYHFLCIASACQAIIVIVPTKETKGVL